MDSLPWPRGTPGPFLICGPSPAARALRAVDPAVLRRKAALLASDGEVTGEGCSWRVFWENLCFLPNFHRLEVIVVRVLWPVILSSESGSRDPQAGLQGPSS